MELNWQEIVTQVVLAIVGVVISALGTFITCLINKKLKDDKAKSLLKGALDVVMGGVQYTYQTYVENLKGTSLWDENAMKIANQKAIDYIKNNLSADMVKYLQDNGKDITTWIKEQIEIAIKKSKDEGKTSSTIVCTEETEEVEKTK